MLKSCIHGLQIKNNLEVLVAACTEQLVSTSQKPQIAFMEKCSVLLLLRMLLRL